METYSFFNSVNNDRTYSASDFANYFKQFLTNGIFPNPSTNLQAFQTDIFGVSIAPGSAFINGYNYTNDENNKLTLDPADSVLNRKDLIVVRLDTINRIMQVVVKKGIASANPIAPTVQQDDVLFELALAEISVNAGATVILQNNIMDTRMDTSRSGFVNSLIQADTQTIFNDYENWYTTKTAEFEQQWNDWFTGESSQLTNSQYEQELADHETRISTNETNITSLQSAVNNIPTQKPLDWANAKDYGADTSLEDNAPKINAAINDVASKGGGVVYVPAGTWKLQSPVYLKSNIVLKSTPNTIFFKNAEYNSMFRNDSDGTQGGYNASANITIEGGVFDANRNTYAGTTTIIAFGHAKNIIVKDAELRNLGDWHMIEFNAVQFGKISNCYFHTYGDYINKTGSPSYGTEMVQLDLAIDSAAFPWFGPYDNTPCKEIVIEKCTFEDGVKAIGSHSAASTSGYEHGDIKIVNNFFQRMAGAGAIWMYNWNNVLIDQNTFYDMYFGISINNTLATSNYRIVNNTFLNINWTNMSRALQVVGNASNKVNSPNYGLIANNFVNFSGRHGLTADNSLYWTWQGNIFNGTTQTSIYCYGTENAVIQGNQVINGNAGNIAGVYDITINNGAKNVVVKDNQVKTMSLQTINNIIAQNNIISSSLVSSGHTGGALVSNNIINSVLS